MRRDTCPINCCLCYANVRGRSNYKNHRGYRKPPKVRWFPLATYVQPPMGDSGDGKRRLIWPDPAFLAAFPAIAEFMTLDKWDDGKPRAPSTLTLFASDGRLKASFNDKALDRVGFLTADTLEELLVELNASLEANTLDWRRHSGGKAGGRSGK